MRCALPSGVAPNILDLRSMWMVALLGQGTANPGGESILGILHMISIFVIYIYLQYIIITDSK